MFTERLLLSARSSPSGGKGWMQVSLSTATQERIWKTSVQGKSDKVVNLKESASCIHYGHMNPASVGCSGPTN